MDKCFNKSELSAPTTINDKKFNELYEPELSEHEGAEKGGACMRNTAKLARYFEGQGLSLSKMRLLYIIAPTPLGPDVIKANKQMLREQEQHKLRLNNKPQAEWGYHAAVITTENKVFDLSANKTKWGSSLREYMEKMFLDDKGQGNHNLRFIITPIEAAFEMSEQRKKIPISDLTKRGNLINAGMSSIWMLQNKSQQELFFKA